MRCANVAYRPLPMSITTRLPPMVSSVMGTTRLSVIGTFSGMPSLVAITVPCATANTRLSMSSCVTVVRSHLHEECFFLLSAEQCAVQPQLTKKVADDASHVGRGGLVVRLEYDRLRAFVNRFLDEDEEPPHVDVRPERV